MGEHVSGGIPGLGGETDDEQAPSRWVRPSAESSL